MSTVTLKTKNVNSKLLFQEINKMLFEEISDSTIRWSDDSYREAIDDIISTMLEEYREETKITQFNVISNSIHKRLHTITVKYRQKHCLNVTEIVYTIAS